MDQPLYVKFRGNTDMVDFVNRNPYPTCRLHWSHFIFLLLFQGTVYFLLLPSDSMPSLVFCWVSARYFSVAETTAGQVCTQHSGPDRYGGGSPQLNKTQVILHKLFNSSHAIPTAREESYLIRYEMVAKTFK